MDILMQDIENAKRLIGIDTGRNNYDKYSKIFSGATENVSGYYGSEELNVNNQDILTICSSGDHALNAIAKGASKVDTFDLNKLTMYYMRLKEAGVRELDIDDFIKFFIINAHYRNNEQAFSYDIYKKIARSLDDDIKSFWYSLYDYCGNDGIVLRKSNLFEYSPPGFNIYLMCNRYLEEGNYKKLQQSISNKQIGFMQSDVYDLPTNLKTTYDKIFLSNICSFFKCSDRKQALMEFRKFLDTLSVCLNDDGAIAAAYVHNYFFNSDYVRQMLKTFGERGTSIHCELYDIWGDEGDTDVITIYQKQKTIK